MASLSIDNVSVELPIYSVGTRSLRKSVLRMSSGGRLCRDAGRGVYVQALRDVTLHIEEGGRVGVVGPNGAGKTTLLRVLAGVYAPTHGSVHRNGLVSPLFNASLGMNMEATGYENIVLRGLFLGLSAPRMRSMTEDIADFTELGDYLAMPVYTYSDGMRLRLALAVSTCFDPEILLMDEWIGTGDAHFLDKIQRRLEGFIDRSSILVVASHSNALIKRLCDTAVLLNRGEVVAIGPVDEVLEQHQAMV